MKLIDSVETEDLTFYKYQNKHEDTYRYIINDRYQNNIGVLLWDYSLGIYIFSADQYTLLTPSVMAQIVMFTERVNQEAGVYEVN